MAPPWPPHLCVAAAADGPSPVGDVDAVRVPDQPVVVLGEVGPRVLGHRAVDVMEQRRLIPVHVQLVEPGPGLSEEHSGSNLNRAQESEAGPEVKGNRGCHEAREKFPISADMTPWPNPRHSRARQETSRLTHGGSQTNSQTLTGLSSRPTMSVWPLLTGGLAGDPGECSDVWRGGDTGARVRACVYERVCVRAVLGTVSSTSRGGLCD